MTYWQPFPSDTKENRGNELRYPLIPKSPISGFTMARISALAGWFLIIGAIAFFGVVK